MSDVDLTDDDRTRITGAVEGKTIPQVKAATEKIRREYIAGQVRTLIPFACKILRDQEPVKAEIDIEESRQITRARRLCEALNLPWNDFHVQVLDAVRRFPTRLTAAERATWDDHRARILPSNATAAQWFERFIQHVEQGMVPAS